MKRFLAILFLSSLGFAQTDYNTQVKNGPILNDASSVFSSLATLCASTSKVQISRTWNVTTNTSCTPALNMVGGKFVVSSNVTLTINTKDFTCATFIQCFDTSASGAKVVFTHQPVVIANWFGADDTGTNDSAQAINAAWTSIKNGTTQSGTVLVNCGTYKINSTLTLGHSYMAIFSGLGACTQFTWSGNNSSDFITDANCFQCTFEDFRIIVNSSNPLLYGIHTENDGTGGPTPTNNHFKNIQMEGSGYLTTGVLMDGPTDGNNDQQKFELVKVFGYTHSAFTIGSVANNGYNILNVEFNHCGFASAGFGQYGVEQFHGSYTWDAGDGSGNYGSDFYFAPGGEAEIRGSEFEDSTQLITTSGPGGINTFLNFHDNHFGGECVQATQTQVKANCAGYTPAGNFITWKLWGPAIFKHNRLGAIGPNAITIALSYLPSANQGGVFFEDNTIGSTYTTISTLFAPSTNQPNRFIGNSYFDGGGALHYFTNTINDMVSIPAATATFSPALAFGGSSTGITYGSDFGNYATTGGTTNLSIHFTLTSKGSATGAATIPIPVTAVYDTACQIGEFDSFSTATNILAWIRAGNNYIELFWLNSGTTQSISNAHFTNTTTLVLSCSIH